MYTFILAVGQITFSLTLDHAYWPGGRGTTFWATKLSICYNNVYRIAWNCIALAVISIFIDYCNSRLAATIMHSTLENKEAGVEDEMNDLSFQEIKDGWKNALPENEQG
ncbi:hypothetical protein QVD17_30578 [Tagetes erecta]|uniref:Uncharacterized protein n=1 Tax=Tagetes erecta TaxID=13708 RepID=A0AAD8K1T0_TARER|nr:hypothetical protein QVD17_30578 [Tagetes erecta]